MIPSFGVAVACRSISSEDSASWSWVSLVVLRRFRSQKTIPSTRHRATMPPTTAPAMVPVFAEWEVGADEAGSMAEGGVDDAVAGIS